MVLGYKTLEDLIVAAYYDPYAAHELARIYFIGDGVVKDYHTALRYFVFAQELKRHPAIWHFDQQLQAEEAMMRKKFIEIGLWDEEIDQPVNGINVRNIFKTTNMRYLRSLLNTFRLFCRRIGEFFHAANVWFKHFGDIIALSSYGLHLLIEAGVIVKNVLSSFFVKSSKEHVFRREHDKFGPLKMAWETFKKNGRALRTFDSLLWASVIIAVVLYPPITVLLVASALLYDLIPFFYDTYGPVANIKKQLKQLDKQEESLRLELASLKNVLASKAMFEDLRDNDPKRYQQMAKRLLTDKEKLAFESNNEMDSLKFEIQRIEQKLERIQKRKKTLRKAKKQQMKNFYEKMALASLIAVAGLLSLVPGPTMFVGYAMLIVLTVVGFGKALYDWKAKRFIDHNKTPALTKEETEITGITRKDKDSSTTKNKAPGLFSLFHSAPKPETPSINSTVNSDPEWLTNMLDSSFINAAVNAIPTPTAAA